MVRRLAKLDWDKMAVNVERLTLSECLLVAVDRFVDGRGYFCETYNHAEFCSAGIGATFVQDNASRSAARGTVRGLHFQAPPFAQDKLIRVVRGRIFDVAVDIRTGSPTFGRHVAVELSEDRLELLYVPAGFAHGFCTLEPETEVSYKVSAPYAPGKEGGVLWSDPALEIAWPTEADTAVLSEKDLRYPVLAELPAIFNYSQAG